VVDFKGLDGEVYYATLLSETRTTGPYSVYVEDNDGNFYQPGGADYAIWENFVAYEDADGYYFLQFFGECTDTARFAWGYYPPSRFKILVYLPETDSFISSGICERYAFDSYFTARVTGGAIQASENRDGGITVSKSYNYGWELLSLALRIVGTVALEVAAALLFGFRGKKQLRLILLVNIATQVLLNVALNFVGYKAGGLLFVVAYVLLEVCVIAFEAPFYALALSKLGEGTPREGLTEKKWYCVLYAVIANVVSFGLGLLIARIVPGIF
jgi:hypothetical protein